VTNPTALHAAERDLAVQALWDVYAALGFDTDGDKTPAARISGMGVAGFARSVVNAAAEHRREAESDYEADVAQAERRGQGCPTPCDLDCAAICHEVHEVSFKRDHSPEDCRATQIAEAERRGALKALRWFEGNTNGANHAVLATTWLETRDRANEIENGADI
jgi:hypothetical protein